MSDDDTVVFAIFVRDGNFRDVSLVRAKTVGEAVKKTMANRAYFESMSTFSIETYVIGQETINQLAKKR